MIYSTELYTYIKPKNTSTDGYYGTVNLSSTKKIQNAFNSKVRKKYSPCMG
jgi:hypothetical protein